jgi:hypothetical protein
MTTAETRATGLSIPKCLESDAAPKKRNESPEHDEQVIVANALTAAGILFSASLAGVGLSRAQRGKAKARGVQAGDPDLTIWLRPPAHSDRKGMMVEMKTTDESKTLRADRFAGTSAIQRKRLIDLECEGFIVCVGYGASDALSKIRAAGYRV